jgi:hypothetical protein
MQLPQSLRPDPPPPYLITLLLATLPSDEGMTNGPSTFAYLVFRPRRDIVKGISKPMKRTAWRGPGT